MVFLPRWPALYTKKLALYVAPTLNRVQGIHSETSCARESVPKMEQIAPAMIDANDIVTKGTNISATGSGDTTLKAKIAHS